MKHPSNRTLFEYWNERRGERLADEFDRVLVWTFAFVPARYDASALTDGILPGGWGAEVWTFFTYALLHADWTHFGFNAVWLLAFASPVARRFGAVSYTQLTLPTTA
jgi:membrane associated rhomboid family serine protease